MSRSIRTRDRRWFSLAGLIERDWITIRPRGRNGTWQGVLDRESRGLGLIWPVLLPPGAFRATLISYGSAAAVGRLKRVVEELSAVAVDRVRIEALPRDEPKPNADALYERPNFTYAVTWRNAKPL